MKLKDGTVVPGSTTVLGLLNKPYLLIWANKLGKDGIDYDDYVGLTRKRGILVHSILESYISKKEISLENYSEDDIAKAEGLFFNHFLPWVKENNFKSIFSEKEFVSENNKFGGIVDAYGEVNGKKTLIDFKTSSQIYDEHLIQLVSYWHLLEENGIEVEQAMIINLKRDTQELEVKVIDKNFLLFDSYWRLFLSLVDVYFAKKEATKLEKAIKKK